MTSSSMGRMTRPMFDRDAPVNPPSGSPAAVAVGHHGQNAHERSRELPTPLHDGGDARTRLGDGEPVLGSRFHLVQIPRLHDAPERVGVAPFETEERFATGMTMP